MTPEQLQAYRELFVNYCDYATNGPNGRGITDPVYFGVVEGPKKFPAGQPPYFSSCAELAHFAYFRLGFRNHWINRYENGGWRVGANLNCWCPKPIGPNDYAEKPRGGDKFETGDIIVISNRFGGHVLCVTLYDDATQTVDTAEYGQPGGAQHSHSIGPDLHGGLVLGAHHDPIISRVSLARALELESQRGTLAAPDIHSLDNWQAPEALLSIENRIGYQAP